MIFNNRTLSLTICKKTIKHMNSISLKFGWGPQPLQVSIGPPPSGLWEPSATPPTFFLNPAAPGCPGLNTEWFALCSYGQHSSIKSCILEIKQRMYKWIIKSCDIKHFRQAYIETWDKTHPAIKTDILGLEEDSFYCRCPEGVMSKSI